MKTTDIKNIASAYMQVLEGKTNEEKKPIDKVQPSELQGTHAQRKDKDIDNDGDVDKSDEYLHNRRKAISKAMKKEEVELDENQRSLDAHKFKQAAKVKAGIPLRRPGESLAAYVTRKQKAQAKMQKEEAELDESFASNMNKAAKKAHADAAEKIKKMGPVTRDTLADINAKLGNTTKKEEVELDEASKEHLERLKAMLDKAKPGSADHSQIRHAISAQYGAKHIPAKHRNVKPDMYEETEKVRWPVLARIMERAAHGNMDNGSPRGEGLSPSAKDQLATATESDIDGNKAAADTAKAATANVKVGPKRRGDNTNGDKTMPTGK